MPGLRVLFLEDEPEDVELALYELRRAGYDPLDWERVDTEKEFVAHLDRDYDIILADYNLPSFDALTALKLMEERHTDVPVILLSAHMAEENAVALIKSGAADYLLKDRLTRLGAAVELALAERRLRKQKQESDAARQEVEDRYRRLVEFSPDGILVVREEIIVFANAAVARMFGAVATEILPGTAIETWVTAEFAAQISQMVTAVYDPAARMNFHERRLQRHDKASLDVEVAVLPFTYQGQPAAQVVMRDITERKRAEAQIRAGEQTVRSILHGIRDGYYESDLEGNLTYVNDAILELTGVGREQLIGVNYADFTGEETAKQVFAYFNQAAKAEPQDDTFSFEIIREDGERRLIEVSVAPAHDENDRLSGFRGIVRDITQRDADRRALERLAEYRERLLDLSESILSDLDVDRIIQQSTVALSEMLDFDRFGLFMLDEEAGLLRRHHSAGVNWHKYEGSNVDLPLEGSLTGTAVNLGQPMLFNQAQTDPRTFWSSGNLPQHLHVMVIPLRVGGKALGAFTVGRSYSPPFEDIEFEMARLLVGQVALAMENARLLEAERDQRALADNLREAAARLNSTLNLDDVIEEILGSVDRIVPYDGLNLMLLEGSEARVIASRGYDGSSELSPSDLQTPLNVDETKTIRDMMSTRRPLMVKDTHTYTGWIPRTDIPDKPWVRSYLGAPLVHKGTVIGFINLDSQHIGFFNEMHAQRLQILADQIALAVANARLLEAERDQRVLADSLREAAARLNRTLNLDEVLEEILATVEKVVPYDGLNLMMLEDGLATVVASRGYMQEGALDPPDLETSLVADETVTMRQMIDTHRPVIVRDTHEFEGWIPRTDIPNKSWVRSYMGAPLVHKGTVIGFINLDSQHTEFFNETHAERLQILADQIALAVANARLLEAEREQRGLAEALHDTAEALSHSLDLDEILESILSNIGQVVPHESADVMLVEEGFARIARHHTIGHEPKSNELLSQRFRIGNVASLKQMAGTLKPVIIADLKDYENRIEFPETSWARAYMASPVVLDREVIGFLTLLSSEPGFFSDEHARRLQAFSNQAAVAIGNARLLAETQRRAAELEALRETMLSLTATLGIEDVLDNIIESALKLLPGADNVYMYLYENGQLSDGRAHWASGKRGMPDYGPRPDGLHATVARSGEAIAVTDLSEDSGVRSSFPDTAGAIVVIPLRIGDQVVGVISAYYPQPRNFPEAELRLLYLMGDQAAIAIQNARFYRQVQRDAAQLEALRQVTLSITGQLDLNTLLETLATSAFRLVASDGGGIYLYRPERNVLEWAVRIAPVDLEIGTELSYGEGLAGKVWQTGRPIAVEDYSTWEGRAEKFDNVSFGAVVGVPIHWGEELLGVITANGRPHQAYTEQDIHLLSLFAAQAAIAIRNAQYIKTVRNYASDLETRVIERTTELNRVKERVETILSNSPDAILVLRSDGAIESTNRAFHELFGYTPDDMVGRPPVSLLRADFTANFAAALQQAVDGNSARLEVVAQDARGKSFDADAALAPVLERGRVTGVVCSLRDISGLKEVERMKDSFVSNVSHELRTPIANFKLYRRLLAEAGSDEKHAHYLTVLQRESERLEHIVEDMLRLSGIDQGQITLESVEVDLNEIAHEYVEDRKLIAAEKNLSLTLKQARNLKPVYSDPGLVGEALSILLSNALNYTHEEGEIKVTTRVRKNRGESWAGVSVADKGPGITPADKERLFERFFRGQAAHETGVPGTGLGLALLKEIVERLQGEIEVQSEGVPGKGATFTIWLRQKE